MEIRGNQPKSNPISVFLLVLVIAVIGAISWFQIRGMMTAVSISYPRLITLSPKPHEPAFNMEKHSLTKADSLWVITNKSHPLNPISYVPDHLVSVHGGTVNSRMVYDLDYMFDAAGKDGIGLTIVSSYRSYNYQVNLYDNYVKAYGQTMADTFSARAGYSEHQTGLAIDFGSLGNPACNVDDCYAETTAGKWLAAHALDYGFLLRYPSDKQQITGYKFEPWHYRYIGHTLADEMKKRSITTLEEFFDVDGGPTYRP